MPSQQRLATQYEVTRAIAESETLNEAAQKILRAICEHLDWQVGALWTVDRRDDVLRCAEVYDDRAPQHATFASASWQRTFARHVGLPGLVWATGAAQWLPDLSCDPDFKRREIAAAGALHSGVAFPILRRGDVAGVIEIFSRAVRPPDDDLLRMFTAIGSQIGQFVERAEAVAALREREDRYALVLAGADAAIWDWDVVNKRVEYSPRWKQLRGYADHEVSGAEEEWVASIHPDDYDRVMKALQAHFDGQTELFVEEYRVRHKDGHWIWILDRGIVRRDATGRVVRMAGSETDITERKRAEEALRASEERYRAVVESQAEMICRFRPDGTILFVNAAYAAARSETVATLTGGNFWHFIPDADRPAVRAMLDRLTPESPEIRIENQFETIDGVRWTLWTNRALLFDESGRWLEAQSAGIDITDRKRAEEALKEADRRKDEFIATLAHELRNPLAPVRNALEVMKLAPNDSAVVEQARAMMERQLTQMIRLIDDLLDLSRVSRGKIVLRSERLSLATVIQQAVETSRPGIEQAGHQLTIHLPADHIEVDGDAVRLAQVFANLLNNAAKFTPTGGHVRLTIERQGADAIVTVRDNGVGIPPDMLTEVFEVFAQVDHALERAHGGLGIGLSLVKRIVDLHGGRVEARSDGRGKGSEFVVRLPIATTPRSQPESESNGRARLVGGRILVVDDNHDAAVSLAMMLHLLGCDTRTAHDGIEALGMAEAFRPDLILLDIGLPRLNGYDVARKIREAPWGRDMVLVAVTGWGQEGDQRRSREAGFDAHLVKPVAPAALEQVLMRLQPVA